LHHHARGLSLALAELRHRPLFALVFGLYLRWLPVAGWQHGAPRYLVLPVLTLALPVAAYVGETHPRQSARGGSVLTMCAAPGARAWAHRACCGVMRCARP